MDPLQFFLVMLAVSLLITAIWQAPSLFFGPPEDAPLFQEDDPMHHHLTCLNPDCPDCKGLDNDARISGLVDIHLFCNGCSAPIRATLSLVDDDDEPEVTVDDRDGELVWTHHWCVECMRERHPEYLRDKRKQDDADKDDYLRGLEL